MNKSWIGGVPLIQIQIKLPGSVGNRLTLTWIRGFRF
jgi:hypothetical protein